MENMLELVKFNADGLVPAVTQDIRTDEVLMLAWMNEESLRKTIETGKVHYYSRSRQKLWLKGETSGHFQQVRSISVDCDGDTLLIKVEQTGAACHTGHRSCFFTRMDLDALREGSETVAESEAAFSVSASTPESGASGATVPDEAIQAGPEVLGKVFGVISDRLVHPKEGSYTNYLFGKGLDKILKKVGEEACEVVIASKNGSGEEIRAEVADLLYHLMVLLVEKGMTMEDIYGELKKRE
jgi:phosphoribosyl-ATP pyrophosphohydrolase/phosphoribosyl-AMP cyclohydrolase